MKKLILFCLTLLLLFVSNASAAFYRTQIIFNNHVAGSVEEPVFLPDGTGPGPDYNAQLFMVQEDGLLKPLFPIGAFRSGTPAAYFYISNLSVILDSLWFDNPISTTITLRLRAWKGDSWETSPVRGESENFLHEVYPLNGPRPPGVPSKPVNFRGFTLTARPVISSITHEPGSPIRLSISAEFASAASICVLERSSNLLDWEEVGTFTVTNGDIFLNGEPENTAGIFYRLRFQ
jgi:hypothetical protein